MTEKEKEPTTDSKEEPKTDDKTTDDGSKSATLDDVKRIINDALEPIKSAISGAGGNKSDSDDNSDDGKQDDKSDRKGRTERRLSLADVQKAASDAVLEAVEKAGLNKPATDEKKEEPRAPVEAKPPSKPRRLSSLMLGKNYLNEANK